MPDPYQSALTVLDEFDAVAIGVCGARSDLIGVRAHRPERTQYRHVYGDQALAGRVSVGHPDREMAERGPALVSPTVPVMGKLDRGPVLLETIADERKGERARG